MVVAKICGLFFLKQYKKEYIKYPIPPMSIETPLLKNGKKNPKYVDLMTEDKPIPGQKFGCFSFICPEHILKKRELFLFERFVKNWDMSKSMEKFNEFNNFVAFKYNLNMEKVAEDFNDFIKEEEAKIKKASALEDDWKNFMDKNEDSLTHEFNRNNEFQTSVRGFKDRGNFPTQEEAERYAKTLREEDPDFDIFVGPVGVWMPIDMPAYKAGKTEYLEPTLNKLFEEKHKNEEMAKKEFNERVKDSKKKAIEENIKLATASGNKLTQTIDQEGNLIGVNTMSFDERVVADDEDDRKTYENQLYENSTK
jgi:hypothetical protein